MRMYAGKGAVISACGRYRYLLWRILNGYADMQWQRRVLWVMLNPSTADANVDDRTIGRCAEFSEAWGYTGFNVCNLYAYRATNPRDLETPDDPVGPRNYRWLHHTAQESVYIILGWGSNVPACSSFHYSHVRTVLDALGHKPVMCLGTTKSGAPKHPLYVAGSTPPRPWVRP
jgi:hypothetical protein